MPELSDQLDGMEKKRAELLQLVEIQDPEARRRPPAPEKWTVLQIIWHLVDAEQKSIATIRKQFDKSTRHRTGLKSRLKSVALRTFLALDIPIKAPPVVAAPPATESLDFATLKADWDAVRADWRQMAESLPSDRHRDALFKHPIAGKLSFAQALDFQDAHADRHARQIRALVGS
ncbi:MAG: DinB family protein [Acidobacteriota bacterium]